MQTIIGIDFGTTNSEVAVYRAGRALIIPNLDGEKVIPSVVFIDEKGERYVGQSAKNVALLHPDRTVKSVKRELGSQRRYWIGGQEYSPEDIASFIISDLRRMAEDFLGEEATKAVLTVPAYFDDPKRQATKRAAALAGLEVVRLINEPTAAALAYGERSIQQGNILVYDLGGGTFDISVLHVGGGVFQVMATRGDCRLGGDDFDRGIAEVLCDRFREETGIDLKEDRLALQKIYQEAERLKIRLSEHGAAEAEIPFIAANLQGPCHLATRLGRKEFEDLISCYIDKTMRLTKGALQDAGIKPKDIDRILLVGGCTSIPVVRKTVEELFGRSAEGGVSPEEAVACGAAVQGGVLAGEAKQMALVDVTPLGLGVETERDQMVTLVPRNTVLPVLSRALFTTVVDNQKSARIKVLQGERPRASDNVLLGSFRVDNILQEQRGKPNIEVCFEIDVEGIVHVSAQDLQTGSGRSIELNGINDIPRERVESILTEARASELEDIYASSYGERDRT